eukprot:8793350-Pyramimonas_sp.AAC.1
MASSPVASPTLRKFQVCPAPQERAARRRLDGESRAIASPLAPAVSSVAAGSPGGDCGPSARGDSQTTDEDHRCHARAGYISSSPWRGWLWLKCNHH